MKINILVIGLLKIELFFSISAILGYTYIGSESSPIYLIFMIGIGILNIAIVLWEVFRTGRLLIKDISLIIGIPFLVLISYLFAIIEYGYAEDINRYFNNFLAFSFPSIYIGFYYGKNNKEKEIINLTPILQISMLLLTIGSIASIIIPVLRGVGFTQLGGASYQSASYYAAFSFGLNVYYLVWGENHNRLHFMRSRLYRILSVILIPIQIVSVIIPGGRGAFVQLFVYIIITLIEVLRERKRKKTIVFLFSLIMLALVIILISPYLMENDFFQRGFNRVLSFVSPSGGINWEETSGRKAIYEEAIDLFKKSPLIGYGLFGYNYQISIRQYPHNIILEVLLQGGIIYLLIFVLLLLKIFIKIFKLIKIDNKWREILFLFIYPLTGLMFSGSYLSTSIFWFVVISVISVSLKSFGCRCTVRGTNKLN